MQSIISTALRRSSAAPWLRPAIPCAMPSLLQLQPPQTILVRAKHSKTQIKRLFKNHPARQRVHERLGMIPEVQAPPARTYDAVIASPEILSNGWTPPPAVPVPDYPFRVMRTRNKPKDAVGFLPVYSKMRYVLFGS